MRNGGTDRGFQVLCTLSRPPSLPRPRRLTKQLLRPVIFDLLGHHRRRRPEIYRESYLVRVSRRADSSSALATSPPHVCCDSGNPRSPTTIIVPFPYRLDLQRHLLHSLRHGDQPSPADRPSRAHVLPRLQPVENDLDATRHTTSPAALVSLYRRASEVSLLLFVPKLTSTAAYTLLLCPC